MNALFSDTQQAALAEIAAGRLTVVRAGPGSGKTRVFVEALRRELERWTSSRTGIAALSFTNAAHEVISSRVTGVIGPPHFVGTLDSFLWRTVVKPFGHLAGVRLGGATVVPSPVEKMLRYPLFQYGESQKQRGTLFEVAFVKGSEDAPSFVHEPSKVRLDAKYAGLALIAKQQEWRSRARLTHSDVQYLAARILRGPHGARVCKLIACRFPVIFVDEFQDTGWFLARAMLALLATPEISGAVVGDPDQTIYQFSGASRSIFETAEKLSGKPAALLNETHRCEKQISAVASHLSRSGLPIVSKTELGAGRCVLLVHNESGKTIAMTVEAIAERLAGHPSIGFLCRTTSVVKRISKTNAEHKCPYSSGAAHKLATAVELLLDGEASKAARILRHLLADLAFESESIRDEAIQKLSVSLPAWRRVVHELLMESARVVENETWNGWQGRLKSAFLAGSKKLGHPIPSARLGANFRKEQGDETLRIVSRTKTDGRATAMTVHQAKGSEYDAVAVYVPKPGQRGARCPSNDWWSNEPGSEEREIAFVACTRARKLLVVAVHKDTHAALVAKRPDFVKLFEIETLS